MTDPAPSVIRVELEPGREKPAREGHPWIFSGAVRRTSGPQDAALAHVYSADGKPLGQGFWSPGSQIRVRLVGPIGPPIDRAFFAARLAEALELRRLVVPPDTTGYRVLNAEGDGLPGWTVDRFGNTLVSQITVAGLDTLAGEAYAALGEAFPGFDILEANDLPTRRFEGLAIENRVIAGDPAAEVPFLESGLELLADLADGQKTGYYCDLRDSRRKTERLAAERRMLDLFAHTGAFGLYAARGGARAITHVESAPRLVERGPAAYARNGFPAELAEWVRADVFQDLRQRTELYDLVICDPPPLVRRRADLERGARAYKDLNRLALKRVAPGGFFLTFSCSAAVDVKLFRQILFAAAVEAGVRLALLEPLAAAPDHPVSVTHLQGDYLKGWLCRVQAP